MLAGCRQPWPTVKTLVIGESEPDKMQSTPAVNLGTLAITVPNPTKISPISSPTMKPGSGIRFFIADEVPAGLANQISLPAGVEMVRDPAQSNLKLAFSPGGEKAAEWIYALVAPFPTIEDDVPLPELMSAWKNGQSRFFGGAPLMMSKATLVALSLTWGAPKPGAVQVHEEAALPSAAWKAKQAWAIVPFEALNPRWKVLRINGISPLDKSFKSGEYPLKAAFALQGEPAVLQRAQALTGFAFPKTNRDASKLTVVVMTGVTALVRGTAWMMEKMGMTFPGKSIRDWMVNADITHVSHEVSFNPRCAPPIPNDPNLRFCSDPKYIELLEYLGVDVVEMTGNHLNDFGTDALLYTFNMYKQRKWVYFGAGENAISAQQPIRLSHNGNKIAFIGCNPAGPPSVWATESKPGAAKCNLDWEVEQIKSLTQQGYLVIATFQYAESYEPRPLPNQMQDFRKISDAGAVIVSGSQAHLPQAMELRENHFIHYGLGNLIFDQMDTYWEDTRYEFIDRHTFYEGRYLGTELLTAQLEDYTRPDPMTAVERANELRKMFDASDWRIDINKEWK